MTIYNNSLQNRYNEICYEYIVEFCLKQEMSFLYWIADIVGGIAEIDDYSFNFNDIVLDINTNQPKGKILDWYNDNVESGKHINYYSYIKGLRVEYLNILKQKDD